MQKGHSQDERRQHLRLDYSRLISFSHHDPSDNIEVPGKMAAVKDISEAGVLIETAEAFQLGTRLNLDIAFEQEKIVRVLGEVVHVRKSANGLNDVGVKFEKLKKGDKTFLKKFIDACNKP